MPTSPKRESFSRLSLWFRFWGLILSLLSVTTDVQTDGQTGNNGGSPKVETNPYYDANADIIYFTDRESPGSIRCYHPKNNSYYGAMIKDYVSNKTFYVSFAIPIQDNPNTFVVGLDESIGVVQWDGMSDKTLSPLFYIKVLEKWLVTSGKTDANGMLWLAVPDYDSNYGNLIWVNSDGQFSDPIKMLGLRDKIAFTEDRLFYTDDSSTIIYEMSYDSATKNFSNSNAVFNMTALNLTGECGGMDVDSNGNLWVACYSGPTVGFNRKTKTVIGSFNVPGKLRLNYVTFGGKNLDVLYATTNTEAADNELPLIRVNDFKGSVTGVADVPAKFPSQPRP